MAFETNQCRGDGAADSPAEKETRRPTTPPSSSSPWSPARMPTESHFASRPTQRPGGGGHLRPQLPTLSSVLLVPPCAIARFTRFNPYPATHNPRYPTRNPKP